MSADSIMADSQSNGVLDDNPTTPSDNQPFNHSQQSLPSTEDLASPIECGSSFKTELNDDRDPPSQVIASSMTPPPSSQVPQMINGPAYRASQRSNMASPPATSFNAFRRESILATEYTPPDPSHVEDASAEELRTMFQACLGENARLKMEAAHHKLQYNLQSMQADEDAKRAQVELEMTRREVEVLRMNDTSRQARWEWNAAQESTQLKYLQLKASYEAALDQIDQQNKRARLAKKLIGQKEDEIMGLTEERDMLRNRIRENREHFNILCSPGGIFHGALTPKPSVAATPQQYRATPRPTPRAARQENSAGFDALLQALNHDNNSAPSTPTTTHRPATRMAPKHTRGVQSMSSLPTTPARPRGENSALLPSADLVPQTEPPARLNHGYRYVPTTPITKRGRKSRESTISVEDHDELPRDELARVALAATQSYMSSASKGSAGSQGQSNEEEDVYESQASQVASEMLRREPREGFEMVGSVGSRDATPAPAEKSMKLQAKLFAGVNKGGLEKRKFDGAPEADDGRSKKARFGSVGLGIRYQPDA